MSIFNVLEEQDSFVTRCLKEFLIHYKQLTNLERVSMIGEIIEMYCNHTELEEKYLYPIARKQPGLEEIVALSLQEHQDIMTQIDRLIMIHVDEPGEEFVKRVNSLLELIEKHSKVEDKFIWPRIQHLLAPDVRHVFFIKPALAS